MTRLYCIIVAAFLAIVSVSGETNIIFPLYGGLLTAPHCMANFVKSLCTAKGRRVLGQGRVRGGQRLLVSYETYQIVLMHSLAKCVSHS